MYRIEKTGYGFRLTFSGHITAEEAASWLQESRQVLEDVSPGFGVFVDMRTQKPLPANTHRDMLEGQRLYKSKGMARSVVVVQSFLLKAQYQQFAKSTGIYKWERYIDASSEADWEKLGQDWLMYETDPDLVVSHVH